MIAIIDITGNNLRSLTNAIKRLGYDYCLSHKKEDIEKASKVILPGVGAARPAMQALEKASLLETLKKIDKPLLGICLGMQLLFERSEEGDVECLGLLPGTIKKLTCKDTISVPHMGWNQLIWQKNSFLQEGINAEDYVYFVHSFKAETSVNSLAIAVHGEPFSAIVQKNQIVGMQFHPEKSGQAGINLLNNFLAAEAIC